ncbi:hypothetical protein F4780DRAFT_796506 [Xylariomycetidae sp. FL0641]|nr:hypothetical protein F4780DRAFT_796506 [Xylariomycetidae sp. FL0641]
MTSLIGDDIVTIENFTALVVPASDPTSAKQSSAIAILVVFPALALLVVCIRVAGRVSSHQFGWDDSLVCIAMAFSILETAASYMFIKTNFIGIRFEDIPPHDPIPGQIWNYAVQILYNPILALVKTSILLFLLRLFGQKPGVRRFIVWVNTANVANMVAVFFAVIFQCIPFEKTWDPALPGTCIDRRVLFTYTSVFNIVTDLVVLGLPSRIFIDLKIPKRTKVALMFVFLLGILVTITSIIRMVLLVSGLFMLSTNMDPDGNIGFVTSAIETNLVLITASAPALRPLLRAWFPSLFRTSGNGDDVKGGATAGHRPQGTTTTNTNATRLTRMKSQTKLRSESPRPSQEEAMTLNGIVRRSDVYIHYDSRSGDVGEFENKQKGEWL